jgi:hypothetical protein
MEWITSFPWGTLASSAFVTTLTAVAILAFGAPAWILLPTTLIGATAHAELTSWVKRRHEHLR